MKIDLVFQSNVFCLVLSQHLKSSPVASGAIGVELLSSYAVPVSWAAIEVKGETIIHLKLQEIPVS